MKRRRGYVTLTIEPDAEQWNAALARVMKDVADILLRRFLPIWRTHLEPLAHIHLYGPANLAGDGTWQTDLCAAWLCGSCPSPRHCDCRCHGGAVR